MLRLRRNKQEIIREAHEEGLWGGKEREVRGLEGGIEVIAEEGGEDGALRDTGVLAVVAFSYFDDVLGDVFPQQTQQIRGLHGARHDIRYEDCVFLFLRQFW